MNEIINVRSWAANTPAIDIAAASSVLKTDKTAIVKDTAISEATKAFSPALAAFEISSSSIFCLLFDRPQKPKKLKRP